MAFGKFIGQKEIKRRLSVMMQGEPSQSFLFTGPEGSGKHTIASELAKALVCEAPTPDGACGSCNCCRYYDAGTLPDVVKLDEEGNIKVADVRRIVVSGTGMPPQISKRKVFIINCDKLNEEGQNAILKSVEEPPVSCAFILMAADKSHILPTILSRVIEFKLACYSEEEIRSVVKMRYPDVEEEKLGFITDFAAGIPGRAIAMVDAEEFAEFRDRVFDMIITMPKKTYTDILYKDFAFLDENKSRIEDILVFMLRVISDIAIMLKVPDSGEIRYKDKAGQIRAMLSECDHLTTTSLARASDAVDELVKGLKVNVSYESACCSMLLKIHKELKR